MTHFENVFNYLEMHEETTHLFIQKFLQKSHFIDFLNHNFTFFLMKTVQHRLDIRRKSINISSNTHQFVLLHSPRVFRSPNRAPNNCSSVAIIAKEHVVSSILKHVEWLSVKAFGRWSLGRWFAANTFISCGCNFQASLSRYLTKVFHRIFKKLNELTNQCVFSLELEAARSVAWRICQCDNEMCSSQEEHSHFLCKERIERGCEDEECGSSVAALSLHSVRNNEEWRADV